MSERLRRAELAHHLGRAIARGDIADHPHGVVALVERLQLRERLVRIARAIPVDDLVDREPHADERRQQLARVVDLVRDLLFPLRQRAHRRVRVDPDLRGPRISLLRPLGLERGREALREVRDVLLELRAAARRDQQREGTDAIHPWTFPADLPPRKS
jgi:hypothetical protein